MKKRHKMHRLSKRFSKSKILITALTAISVIFGTAFAVSAAENYSIYDAAQIQMYIARLTDLPQDKDYDANNDGIVDFFDVTEIQRLLSHSGEDDSNASNKQETTQPTEATTAPAEINFTYYDDYENLGIGETFDLFAENSGDNADTVWQSSNEDVASITSASDS